MEVKLEVANGKYAGRSVRVTGPKFFIGRGEDCQLRPASDLVSRHHCVIIIEGDYVAVRDLGSKNGTYVNGQRVRTEMQLRDGDRLLVGVLEFIVRLGEGAKVKPKVQSVREAAARAASASSTEFDVEQWLSDEEAPSEGASHAETRTIQIDQPKDTAEPTPAPHHSPEKPVDEETRQALASLFSEENQGQSEDVPKKQGDSGKFQKPKPQDTRQAAANVLKAFFRKT
ncbi:MAG: hypothetical protein KatS3mg112_0332 [Thermogutta sp.]|nr:MAG: hypothetical protein KatS3mg112_0332 [Thermogutta sp.]